MTATSITKAAILALALGAPVAAAAQVDLTPESMQIDATSSAPRVRVTVRNAGPAPAPAGQLVRLYDGAPVTNVLGTVSTAAAIAAGATEVVTFALAPNFDFALASGVARQLYVRVDPTNALAESNETNNDNFAYRWREGLNPPVPRQHRVLVVTVNGSYNADGVRLRDAVTLAGGAVTYQVLSASNQVANLIAANTYDQVWVYDLSSGSDNYVNDWAAIGNWFNADPARDVIADGRVIATLWNGLNTTQGNAINDNYYENLRIRGGGLMLGTDHGGGTSPRNGTGVYVTGINVINDRIGIGRFYGDPGGSVSGMPANDPNPLRNIPNNIAFNNSGVLGVRSDSSPGNAPTGFQDASNTAVGVIPLARTFYTLAWHNGSAGGGASTPAISTTMAGTLGFTVTIAGCRTPAQGMSNVMSAAVSLGAVSPLTYEWRLGTTVVGTTATYDTSGLAAGDHALTLVVRDASGFRPGTSVRVVVNGTDCNTNCLPDDEDISSGRARDTWPANGVPDVCEDADQDAVPDIADPAPCDSRIVAEAFAPSESGRGMVLVEDQWPGYSDLDFNDVVSTFHYHFMLGPDGRAVSLRATFDVLALGGSHVLGMGLALPVAPQQVASVSRSINGGAPQSLVPRTDGSRLVVWPSANLRDLFGQVQGPINSVPGGETAPAQQVAVDVVFATPVALPLASAPFDVYVFHDQRNAHEIHRSPYGGTDAMDTALFGTGLDASAVGRWFIDNTGLPYVLTLAGLSPWPPEGQPIETLYPQIVPWAASGGTTNLNWQSSPVAGQSYVGAAAPRVLFSSAVDTSCL